MAVNFFEEMKAAFNKDKPFVICTVVETLGSSPGSIGQKMLVFKNGETVGTVGGGANEEKVRLAAMELFKNNDAEILNFDLNNPIEGEEAVCGGEARVFIELVSHNPHLIIFGAGHIGKVLAKMAVLANFKVTIADERENFANNLIFPDCNVICSNYIDAVKNAEINENSFVVVVTPGHKNDMEVLKHSLKYDAAYFGLVSSAKKLAEMKEVLVSSGIAKEKTDNLFSPIGINLGSNTPEEIAVEILAQIVACRNGKIIKYE